MLVTWDPNKAAANKRDHGISFETAQYVFADPNRLLFLREGRLIVLRRQVAIALTKEPELISLSPCCIPLIDTLNYARDMW